MVKYFCDRCGYEVAHKLNKTIYETNTKDGDIRFHVSYSFPNLIAESDNGPAFRPASYTLCFNCYKELLLRAINTNKKVAIDGGAVKIK